LKLKYDKPLPEIAFKFNLRHYTEAELPYALMSCDVLQTRMQAW
jgi:hypothetical protein